MISPSVPWLSVKFSTLSGPQKTVPATCLIYILSPFFASLPSLIICYFFLILVQYQLQLFIKRCPDIVPPDLTNSCMSRHLIYRQHCTVPKRLICNRMVYTQAMIKMPLENCYLFSQKSVFLLSYCYKGILGF